MAKTIASQTAGAVPRDLQSIVADAGISMVLKMLDASKEENQLCDGSKLGDGQREKEKEGNVMCQTISDQDSEDSLELCIKDVEKAFEHFKSRMASGLGAPKVKRSSYCMNIVLTFLV